jgi:saccharopine dehydrogenase-like NADP-dependent oxidoreductase
MRIWLIGAGQAGTEALRQLQKNDEIDVIVTSDSDQPQAVKEEVIAKVDYVETVTAVNMNALARRIRPDLILVDPAVLNVLSRVSGGAAFNQAMLKELVISSDFPCILLNS